MKQCQICGRMTDFSPESVDAPWFVILGDEKGYELLCCGQCCREENEKNQFLAEAASELDEIFFNISNRGYDPQYILKLQGKEVYVSYYEALHGLLNKVKRLDQRTKVAKSLNREIERLNMLATKEEKNEVLRRDGASTLGGAIIVLLGTRLAKKHMNKIKEVMRQYEKELNP